jgi:hypothetical protein
MVGCKTNFKITAMGLGFRASAHPVNLKEGLAVWATANHISKSASFSVCLRRYINDVNIGQFRITVMDFSGWLSDQRKPGKPKAHLSQFGRIAIYRTFILANSGLQRWTWCLFIWATASTMNLTFRYLTQLSCTATYRIFILASQGYNDELCIWLFGQQQPQQPQNGILQLSRTATYRIFICPLRITAMGLVFGYLGNRKPGKLKGRHFQFYPYCTNRIFIFTYSGL